jgi:dihydrofolate synthase/folylpolyglutamate synthase
VTAFQKALEWLYGTQTFGVKLGLDSVNKMLAELGISPSIPRSFHVAGTNGKGSTCAMLDSICRAAGLRSGLYTSPHLLSFRERIQVCGELIPESAVTLGLDRIRSLVSDWNPHPTFFEITTALALSWFQQSQTEVTILETGLGGRLDATNAVTPSVSILTPIGADHQAILGPTLKHIAAEKAGILKPGVPVVSAPQLPEVAEVIEAVADQKGCPLQWVRSPWNEGPLGLPGSVQRWNAALALKALEVAGFALPAGIAAAGLAAVQWPGRFQKIHDRLILDGSHNAPAAAVLAASWREVFPGEKASLIFGALEDKDIPSILRELAPIVSDVLLTPVHSPRAISPLLLQRQWEKECPHIAVSLAPSLSQALDTPRHCRVLVTGSLYLVGEALGLIQGTRPEWSAQ